MEGIIDKNNNINYNNYKSNRNKVDKYKNKYLSNFFVKLQTVYSSCKEIKTKTGNNSVVEYENVDNNWINYLNNNNSPNFHPKNNLSLNLEEDENKLVITDFGTNADHDLLNADTKCLQTPKEIDYESKKSIKNVFSQEDSIHDHLSLISKTSREKTTKCNSINNSIINNVSTSSLRTEKKSFTSIKITPPNKETRNRNGNGIGNLYNKNPNENLILSMNKNSFELVKKKSLNDGNSARKNNTSNFCLSRDKTPQPKFTKKISKEINTSTGRININEGELKPVNRKISSSKKVSNFSNNINNTGILNNNISKQNKPTSTGISNTTINDNTNNLNDELLIELENIFGENLENFDEECNHIINIL
jgi:hypothetical protein